MEYTFPWSRLSGRTSVLPRIRLSRHPVSRCWCADVLVLGWMGQVLLPGQSRRHEQAIDAHYRRSATAPLAATRHEAA